MPSSADRKTQGDLETFTMAIENVSGTAFVVAEFRAEENAEPAPLYRDPVVELFLSEETRLAAGREISAGAS